MIFGYLALLVGDVHFYVGTGLFALLFSGLLSYKLILERDTVLFIFPKLSILSGMVLFGVAIIVAGHSDFMYLTSAFVVLLGSSFIDGNRVSGVVSIDGGPIYFSKLTYYIPIGVNSRRCDDILVL